MLSSWTPSPRWFLHNGRSTLSKICNNECRELGTRRTRTISHRYLPHEVLVLLRRAHSLRRTHAVVVVLADEQDGQIPQGRDVERLEDLSLVCCAVAIPAAPPSDHNAVQLSCESRIRTFCGTTKQYIGDLHKRNCQSRLQE